MRTAYGNWYHSRRVRAPSTIRGERLKSEKTHNRWESLQHWQKGAILGAGLHLGAVLFIFLSVYLFVPLSPPPGGGDMGTPLGLLFMVLSALVEFIPTIFLYPFTGHVLTLLFAFIGPNSDSISITIWLSYMTYSTIIYALIGILLAKVSERYRKNAKRKQANGL